jgi:agmatine deiminase
LFHPNRNPGLQQDSIENALQEFLGLEQIVWLDGEIAGDDTDGHIDQLARFVSPATVVTASERHGGDANHAPLATLRSQLAEATIGSQPVSLLELPMPSPIYHASQRLPASYANFYVANDVVMVPEFGDDHDETAKCVLRDCFADRLVMGLPCRELVRGLGGFHCLTAGQPL